MFSFLPILKNLDSLKKKNLDFDMIQIYFTRN